MCSAQLESSVCKLVELMELAVWASSEGNGSKEKRKRSCAQTRDPHSIAEFQPHEPLILVVIFAPHRPFAPVVSTADSAHP